MSPLGGSNAPDDARTSSSGADLVQLFSQSAYIDGDQNIAAPSDFSAYSITDEVFGDLLDVVLQVATVGSPRNPTSFVLIYDDASGTRRGLAPVETTTLVAQGGRTETLVRWHPETVQDEIRAFELFFVSGGVGMTLDAVELDTRFSPPVLVFCTGDGQAPCPCANSGSAGHGCDVAQGTGGVLAAVVAQDAAASTATIAGTNYPPGGTPTAILIRGNNEEATPVPFGDGLRCVGTVGFVRLAATQVARGVSTHAFAHAAGPGAFYYQVWFRNTPPSFCSPAPYNLSNGLILNW